MNGRHLGGSSAATVMLVSIALMSTTCDGGSDVATGSSGAVTPPPLSASSSPTKLEPRETIRVDFPQDLEIAFDSLWAVSEFLDAVDRIDVASLELTTIPLGAGFGPQELEVAAGTVWVTGNKGLVRVQPGTNRVVSHIDGSFKSLASGFGSLWAGGLDGVTRIDPARSKVIARILPSASGRCSASVGGGAVWMSCGESVKRIDPATNRIVATVPHPGRVVVAGDDLWLVRSRDIFEVPDPKDAYTTLDRLDPTTNRVIPGTRIELIRGASSVFPRVVGDRILFPSSNGVGSDVGMLYVFDPRTGTVVDTLDLSEGKGYGSNSVVIGYGSLWTASGLSDRIRRWLVPLP
jgi:streptogramin lyase